VSASSEVAYLARALKAPRIPSPARALAERAREGGWDYRASRCGDVSGGQPAKTHGDRALVKRARFPQVRRSTTFDFTFQRSVKRAHPFRVRRLADL
jgi:hypothetical protein